MGYRTYATASNLLILVDGTGRIVSTMPLRTPYSVVPTDSAMYAAAGYTHVVAAEELFHPREREGLTLIREVDIGVTNVEQLAAFVKYLQPGV